MASENQDTASARSTSGVMIRFGDHSPVQFQELGGTEGEHEGVEYRHGNSPIFYPIKMPGLGRVGNVTMRKGIFVGDVRFWNWYNEIKLNKVKPENVVIQLTDETGAPTMTWTLHNARPTGISDTEPESEGNEVAVEAVEVAFETLVVSAP